MIGSQVRVDRSSMVERMKQMLSIDPAKTAVVTIDMQRGNLDPELATLPVPADECERILNGTQELLAMARGAGMQVVHVLTWWHPCEIAAHPFEKAIVEARQSLTPHAQSDYAHHKLEGSHEAEMMPEIVPDPKDLFVTSKRRFDAFYGTNLEILLRVLKIDTVIITGANTNTCVQATVFGAYSRDFRVILASDCVASAYGADLHEFALDNVRRRLGWVLTNQEIAEKLRTQ
ncbi:MAG: cysteine hydrolase family protein [Chloroflexota bacterium]